MTEINNNSEWLNEAVKVVEKSIDRLLDEFIAEPYLHRVEHSLHAQLFNIMKQESILSGKYALADGQMTQLIHKEWPETIPRPENGNRRGNFDLAVLDPADIERSSVDEFRDGRITPPIVIEIGLDYYEKDNQHLSDDRAKMQNSRIANRYLIHFVREGADAEAEKVVHQVVRDKDSKIAYAAVSGISNSARYKRLNESVITSTVPETLATSRLALAPPFKAIIRRISDGKLFHLNCNADYSFAIRQFTGNDMVVIAHGTRSQSAYDNIWRLYTYYNDAPASKIRVSNLRQSDIDYWRDFIN